MKTSYATAVLQLPFHFLWSIKPKVSGIKVNSDQVILSVLAALELLCTAFYQALVLKGRGNVKITGKGQKCQLGRTRVSFPNGHSLRGPAPTLHTNLGKGTATHHVLLFSHYLEEWVVPLQDVDIQEMPRWKGALAEGADIPVQRVVVVLIAFQCVKDLAAPRDVATEFRHSVGKLRNQSLNLSCIYPSSDYICLWHFL